MLVMWCIHFKKYRLPSINSSSLMQCVCYNSVGGVMINYTLRISLVRLTTSEVLCV